MSRSTNSPRATAGQETAELPPPKPVPPLKPLGSRKGGGTVLSGRAATALAARALAATGLAATLVLAAGGCRPVEAPAAAELVTDVRDDQLRARIDAVLDATAQRGPLTTQQHAAWQILHGVLVYQRDFEILHQGRRVSAVDHLLAGEPMKGWVLEPIVDSETDYRGLRAHLEVGSKDGQGHADQWLAVLAQCGLAADQPLVVDEQTFTMSDWVRQVQRDVPFNHDFEFSWTLIGLTTYLPTDASWTAGDGETWSIERLVQAEADQLLADSACGGTHRVIGITMALRRHEQAGRALTPAWRAAKQVIAEAVQDARQYQNPNGSFSVNYFQRPGQSPDLAQNLGSSGHVLEFLALALDEEELREAWVQRAANYVCELLEKTQKVPLECGALYHAAHGLVLYRERVYGARVHGRPANPE